MAGTRTQRLRASATVLAVVVASGVIGATASCSPTGEPVIDHILTGLLAAAAAWAATAAFPFTLAIGAFAVLVGGGSWPLHAIGVVLVIALVVLNARDRLTPLAAAVIGGIVVQSLLRIPWTAPERGSAAVAAAGLLPILVSGAWRGSSDRAKLRKRVFATVVVLGGIVFIGALYIAARTDEILDNAQHDARAGVAAVRTGDRVKAAADFTAASGEFRRSRHFARSWWAWPGRAVPVVAPQLRALDEVSSIGADAVDVAREAVSRVDPEKLRFVDGKLDLTAVESDHAIFADAAHRTDEIQKRLDSISDEWLAPPVEHAIIRFKKTVASAGDSAHTASDALGLAPSILGKDASRTYFIAFVTPAEARGSGGLIANYGVLRAVNGRLHLDQVGRAPSLDYAGVIPKHLTGLADYQARYGRYDVANTWENVTMSPDFPTVAQVISQLYPQSGGTKIDGVMEVGPHGMAGLLALSGPIRVPGLSFALDTHNIVNFLLHDEYTLITDQNQRADVLGNIARATFDKLTSGTSEQPSQISNIMSPVVRAQQLAFWMRDAASQRFIEHIGGDAAVPARDDADSFGATVQNGNGSKIDFYLHRSVHYVAHVDGRTGRVDAKVTLTLRNDAPRHGEPSYIIGNPFKELNGTNRAILSLYSPLSLQGATIDGKKLTLVTEREFDRNVWTDVVDIPATSSRTIVLDLTGVIDLHGGSYTFDYIPQVLANPDAVTVDVDIAHGHTTTVSPGAKVTGGARSVNFSVPKSEGGFRLAVGLRR